MVISLILLYLLVHEQHIHDFAEWSGASKYVMLFIFVNAALSIVFATIFFNKTINNYKRYRFKKRKNDERRSYSQLIYGINDWGDVFQYLPIGIGCIVFGLPAVLLSLEILHEEGFD